MMIWAYNTRPACCTYWRLPKYTEGYRRLPKATEGYRRPMSATSYVVGRNGSRGEVRWLRKNSLTPYPQKYRNSAKEI